MLILYKQCQICVIYKNLECFTERKLLCHKIMFLHLSVILFKGRSQPLFRGISVQGIFVRGILVMGISVQGDLCPGRVSVQGSHRVTDTRPPRRTVTCGRYASYWNALLLYYAFIDEFNLEFTLSENTTVWFSCDDGYTLSGSNTSICGTQGVWNPPLPICQPGNKEYSIIFHQNVLVSRGESKNYIKFNEFFTKK